MKTELRRRAYYGIAPAISRTPDIEIGDCPEYGRKKTARAIGSGFRLVQGVFSTVRTAYAVRMGMSNHSPNVTLVPKLLLVLWPSSGSWSFKDRIPKLELGNEQKGLPSVEVCHPLRQAQDRLGRWIPAIPAGITAF